MEKKLAEIIARMKKIDADQAEIERQAGLENEGEFTEGQRSQYEALGAMFKDLEAEKAKIEKDMALKAERADRAAAFNAIMPRRTQPSSGAPSVPQNRIPGMPIEHENTETGETQIRFKIPKNVLRLGSPTNFHGVRDGLDAEHRAYRFGMWALARISQDLPGRFNFDRAKQFVSDYMNPTNTAHGETDTTGGHYLVPEEFSRDLIDLREMYGVVRRIFGRAPMTGDVLHTPKRASGLTAYFIAENAVGTESNMTWSDIQLVAKNLMVLARMSNQLSADAVISIGDTLAGEIAYAFSNKEDECGFNGDGTSTYGGMTGVRYLLDNVGGATTDSAGKVIQGSSNTWSAMVLGDFNNVVGKLPQYADTPNACWVCHRTFYYSVMQKLEMAAGGTQMMEVSQGDRRSRPLFMGYPVEFSQVFPSATATSGIMCVLGDFTKGALFGDRQQTSIAFSEHASVGGENVFERNQIAIRGTERFDLNVHGCGDASTVGPIVGLATS